MENENHQSCWYPFKEEHEEKVATIDLSRYDYDDTNSVRQEVSSSSPSSSPMPGMLPASSDEDSKSIESGEVPMNNKAIISMSTNCFSGEFWAEEGCAACAEEPQSVVTPPLKNKEVVERPNSNNTNMTTAETLPHSRFEISYGLDEENSRRKSLISRALCKRPMRTYILEESSSSQENTPPLPVIKASSDVNVNGSSSLSSSLVRRAMCVVRKGRSRSLPRGRKNLQHHLPICRSSKDKRKYNGHSHQNNHYSNMKRDDCKEFIEVSATSSQLARVKDLSVKDLTRFRRSRYSSFDLARSASLVDEDSTFMQNLGPTTTGLSLVPCAPTTVDCTQMWHGGDVLQDLNNLMIEGQSKVTQDDGEEEKGAKTKATVLVDDKERMSKKVSRRVRSNGMRRDNLEQSNDDFERREKPRGRISRSRSFHEVPDDQYFPTSSSPKKKGRSSRSKNNRSRSKNRSKGRRGRSHSLGRRRDSPEKDASSHFHEKDQGKNATRESKSKSYDENDWNRFKEEKSEWEREQADWDGYVISGIRKVSSRLSDGKSISSGASRSQMLDERFGKELSKMKSRAFSKKFDVAEGTTYNESGVTSAPLPREKLHTSKVLEDLTDFGGEGLPKRVDKPWMDDDVSGLNTAAFDEFGGNDDDSIFNDLRTETGSKLETSFDDSTRFSKPDTVSRYSRISGYSKVSRLTEASNASSSVEFNGCFS